MGSSYPLVRDGTNRIEPNGPTLAYSLHLPSANPTRAALIAHPYGRLGGSRFDHVVVALAELLCELGYAVVRYDARGAGESEGSASWTGAAEAEDYQELVDSLVLPLIFPADTLSSADSSTAEAQTYHLLLCGYSFGSLAVSSCPARPVPPTFAPSRPSARLLTSYLLISYPLSVLWALTFLRSSPFTTSLRRLVQRGDNRILAVHGDRDNFSAVDKLRAWASELDSVKGSQEAWTAIEVEGADHFWRDGRSKIELLEAVRHWVQEGERPAASRAVDGRVATS